MAILILALFSLVLTIGLSLIIYKKENLLKLQEQAFRKERASIRKDAAFKSSSVSWGMTIENFVPFMEDFPVPPETAIFMGKPIDFVSFTDTEDPKKAAVHIIEVKSGKSQLQKQQRNIREAIKAGRVHWHEVRVAANAKREK